MHKIVLILFLLFLHPGSSTTDDVAAAQARVSSAPNHQDLQATIAPQFTTTGVDPLQQPEIPAIQENQPVQQLPFIEDWPMNDEISELVDHDPMQVEEIQHDLEIFRAIVTSFILTSGIGNEKLKKYKTNLKFQSTSTWCGHFLNNPL